ncbi:MAG TPA: methylmalonyl Co-A mutase-associated GTPase MeaB [Limnochordales bacterium]|nr:methylmalonyl Co-A mutase-associated GTPase MeaB [Limnochordales bacterium]
MAGDMLTLARRLLAGDRRALARLITVADDGGPALPDVLREIHPHTGKAHVIGITGPPGAGKSTLVWALAHEYVRRGRRVGVIAVDPSSPLTGGAVLGDRIRMPMGDRTDGIFFRSMASRGQLGGMSRSVRSVVHMLDAFGKDVILIETVGAGQSDVAVRTIAHTTAVVSVPGLGDDIQMLKAGILEIADVYVVNKADREGADKTAAEIEAMLKVGQATAQALGETPPQDAWVPPIVRTVATKGTGMDRLADAFDDHRRHLQATGRWEAIVRRQAEAELQEALLMQLERALAKDGTAAERQRLIDAVGRREIAAFQAADQLLRRLGVQ